MLCTGVIYFLFLLSCLTLHLDVVLLFIPCCGYFFLSVTHILVLSVPILFVCETSWRVTCPCFYVCPVFCLQPCKCATCHVCLMLTFSSDTNLRQSQFNGNMDDQLRQKKNRYLTPRRETKIQNFVKNLSPFIDSTCFLPNPTPILIFG